MSQTLALVHTSYYQYLQASYRLAPNVTNFALSEEDYLQARVRAGKTLFDEQVRLASYNLFHAALEARASALEYSR